MTLTPHQIFIVRETKSRRMKWVGHMAHGMHNSCSKNGGKEIISNIQV